jgi:hypothetical protein
MAWFFSTFQKEIASLVASLIITGLGLMFRARVELIWSSPHSWNFLIRQQTTDDQPTSVTNIHTASIYIQNIGRLPATEVELTFNWEPSNWNIWPQRAYTTQTADDGRFTLKFDNFAPREHLQIELLASTPLPALLTVRSKECVGKLVTMLQGRTVPKQILYLRYSLIILGMAACIYLPIKLISSFAG